MVKKLLFERLFVRIMVCIWVLLIIPLGIWLISNVVRLVRNSFLLTSFGVQVYGFFTSSTRVGEARLRDGVAESLHAENDVLLMIIIPVCVLILSMIATAILLMTMSQDMLDTYNSLTLDLAADRIDDEMGYSKTMRRTGERLDFANGDAATDTDRHGGSDVMDEPISPLNNETYDFGGSRGQILGR